MGNSGTSTDEQRLEKKEKKKKTIFFLCLVSQKPFGAQPW